MAKFFELRIANREEVFSYLAKLTYMMGTTHVADILKREANDVFKNRIQEDLMWKTIRPTGRLARSIYVSLANLSGAGFSLYIGAATKYAAYVEYGTGVWATQSNAQKIPWVAYWRGKYHTTYGIKGKQFFASTIDRNIPLFFQRVVAQMQKDIKK